MNQVSWRYFSRKRRVLKRKMTIPQFILLYKHISHHLPSQQFTYIISNGMVNTNHDISKYLSASNHLYINYFPLQMDKRQINMLKGCGLHLDLSAFMVSWPKYFVTWFLVISNSTCAKMSMMLKKLFPFNPITAYSYFCNSLISNRNINRKYLILDR